MSTPLLPDLPGPDTFGPKLLNVLPVLDPEGDIDAGSWNNVRATLAALAKVSPKAVVYFTVAASTATLQWHQAVWDDTSPGSEPVVSRISTGLYTVTWPASVNDLQEPPESHPVVLRHVLAGQSIDPATTHVSVDAMVQGNARSVLIRTRQAAGTPVDIAHCYVQVR